MVLWVLECFGGFKWFLWFYRVLCVLESFRGFTEFEGLRGC